MPKLSFDRFHTVELMAPAADAAGRTSDWISLKNVVSALITFHVTQGNAATILLSLLQATAVAGTGSKAGPAVPIKSNLDTAASDTLVRRTDGATYTTDAGVKNKIVQFQIDPSQMDVEGGFDCIAISTGASNAANITQAEIMLEMRYGGETPPSVIVD